MKRNHNIQIWLRAVLLNCVVFSLASVSGNLLQIPSHRISHDHPLSRQEITSNGVTHDAVATRGQTFSLKLCKNQRSQFDLAVAGNTPRLHLSARRLAPFSTIAIGHSSEPVSLPTGRAPPSLA